MKFFRGQISLWVALVGAAGMIGANIVTSYATVSSRVWGVEKKVGIVEERENNHFSELSKKMDNLERKIDRLIETNTVKK